MRFEWKTLTGYVIGERYVLGGLISDREDSATFLTELPSEGGGAVMDLIPSDSSDADRQLHSWSLARRVPHPLLVAVHEAGEVTLNQSRFFYAVKERPDEYLGEVIPTRALSQDEAGEVVEAILLCLEHLHAHGVTHGAVAASSVVAVGGTAKLSSDTLSDAHGFEHAAAADMYALGVSIIEMLTRHRPVHASDKTANALPSPFREIAAGCLQTKEAQRWTPQECLEALKMGPLASTPLVHSEPQSRRQPAGLLMRPATRRALALGGFACAAALILSRQWRGHVFGSTASTTGSVVDDRPSPIRQHGVAERAAEKNPPSSDHEAVPSRVSAASAGEANWGVIAATYRNFDQAQRFANSIHARWNEFACAVYPPRGQAQKYYYVLLGSGLTKDKADYLQQRAISAGLDGPPYVTKIVAP